MRRLGARHIEGCGAHEDHHIFSLEEIEEAVARVRALAQDESFSHACILMTEKDYARQFDLWGSLFSRYAKEITHVNGNGGKKEQLEGAPTWGAYVLHSELQVVDHDRRFSSQKAVLAAMLRMAVDNFRQRSYMS